MATRSYVLRVPTQSDATQIHPDSKALEVQLQELVARIDAAGETIIALQGIEAGWGATFLNEHIAPGNIRSSTFGAGYGFSYTHTLLVITRAP